MTKPGRKLREVVVRLTFTKPCLGNVKREIHGKGGKRWTRFNMPKGVDGNVRFEAVWWECSLRFAADVLGRHQSTVRKVAFDLTIDGRVQLWRRYPKPGGEQYLIHEAFLAGDTIGVNCLVPAEISDDDFWKLMDYIGRFRGVSPFKYGEYGRFRVAGMQQK